MASNKYACRHCNSNLDDGDIFEYYLSKYNDHSKALSAASYHGWSETDKRHFTRDIIVQPDRLHQYIICPDCEKENPLIDIDVKIDTIIEKANKLTNIFLNENKNTEMYEELKNMVDTIVSTEITDLLRQSKYVNYYSSTIIPIIFPLCVIYKRMMSIEWLKTNCAYHNNCGRPVLLANMIKYDLFNVYADVVPKEWHPRRKNILDYVCDDFEATLKYIKINPECFKDESLDLSNCCVQVLKYYVENINGYDVYYLFKRFVDLSRPNSVQKIEYIKSKFRIDYDMIIKQLSAGRQHPKALGALYTLIKRDIQRKLFCETILVIEGKMVFSENQGHNTWPSILFAGKKLGYDGKTALKYMDIESDSDEYEEYSSDFIKCYNGN